MNENNIFTHQVVLRYPTDTALLLAEFIKANILQTNGEARIALEGIQTELETKTGLALACHHIRQDKIDEVAKRYRKIKERVLSWLAVSPKPAKI